MFRHVLPLLNICCLDYILRALVRFFPADYFVNTAESTPLTQAM